MGKPLLILREDTERPELLAAGSALLVGSNKKLICSSAEKLLKDKNFYEKMANVKNPYGDGLASKRISNIIIKKYNL